MYIRCLCITASLLLTACASAPNFSDSLSKPLKQAQSASTFVADTDKDLLATFLLGNAKAIDDAQASPEVFTSLLCGTRASTARQISSELDVMTTAVDAVNEVAKAPAGSDYQSLLAKMRSMLICTQT